jgi:excisionase family DNA binding protein
MLRVKTVAERLSLSISKVYELIEKGQLGHYRLGGAIRVSETQLKDYLDGKEVKPERRAQPAKRKPPRSQLRHIRV